MDNERMGPSEAEIEQELAKLRKRRALTDPTLRERVDPALWAAIGVPETVPQGQVRALLTHRIRTAAQQLPPDLRHAAEAMFGLTGEYRLAQLGDRQRLFAERTRCDWRTARRRCDEALRLLAETLALDGGRFEAGRPVSVDDSAFATGTWYSRELRVLVRLDLAHPEVREERCIVALDREVREVTASTGLLAFDGHGMDSLVRTEVDYGASLMHAERLPGGLSLALVRLPRGLARGEEHWYGRTVRATSLRHPAPQVLYTPSVRCDRLSLRIRFRTGAAPPLVQRVIGVEPGRAPPASPEPGLQVDAANEVLAVFEQLALGRTYGLVWDS